MHVDFDTKPGIYYGFNRTIIYYYYISVMMIRMAQIILQLKHAKNLWKINIPFDYSLTNCLNFSSQITFFHFVWLHSSHCFNLSFIAASLAKPIPTSLTKLCLTHSTVGTKRTVPGIEKKS